jgi:hypothetical protein
LANFSTHIKVAVVTSAALSSVVLSTEIASPYQALVLFLIGSLSGLLPDLDADKSTSISWLFSLFGLMLAGSAIVTFALSSLLDIWLVGSLVYAATQFIIKPLFEKFTVHRGSLHSILASTMFSLLAIHLSLSSKHSLNLSMLVGIFVLLGALTHLILDECYSVDLNNVTVKSSFGSAMKLIETRYPIATGCQIMLVSCAIYLLFPHINEMEKIVALWQQKLTHVTFWPSLHELLFFQEKKTA